MASISNIKVTSLIFLAFFIVLIIFQIYMLRSACNSDYIIQIIRKNSYQIKTSIDDLEKKLINILKIEKNNPEYLGRNFKDSEILRNRDVTNLLPFWDYTTLSDLNNFRFNIINNVCKNDEVDLLIFVTTAPNHSETRKIIRETLGSQKNQKIKMLFSLGAVKTQEEQNQIQKENSRWKDILQGNFIDAYNNLTYKHVMNLKYTTYYCPQTKFVVKMDDDLFVNLPNLQKFLLENLQGCSDYIFCGYGKDIKVWREHTKWGVPFQDYPNSVYPRYCFGNYPIIYPFEVAFNLYKECQKGDFFVIEDAYITGIIAERLNLKHIQSLNYTLDENLTKKILESDIQNVTQPNDFLFAYHSLKAEYFRKFHQIFGKRLPNITHKALC